MDGQGINNTFNITPAADTVIKADTTKTGTTRVSQ
jgi:hypothetical protein